MRHACGACVARACAANFGVGGVRGALASAEPHLDRALVHDRRAVVADVVHESGLVRHRVRRVLPIVGDGDVVEGDDAVGRVVTARRRLLVDEVGDRVVLRHAAAVHLDGDVGGYAPAVALGRVEDGVRVVRGHVGDGAVEHVARLHNVRGRVEVVRRRPLVVLVVDLPL